MIVMIVDNDDDHSNDDLSIKVIQDTDEEVESVHHLLIIPSLFAVINRI